MTAHSPHPVRRKSREAGTFERAWNRPIAPHERGRFMMAAEAYERAEKLRGRRNGRLGYVALDVLRYMLRIVDKTTGRLDPAIQTICEAIKHSRSAVVAALKRLYQAGFVTWCRRFVIGNRKDGRGARYEQTSSSYILAVPDEAEALRPKPRVPECEKDRRREMVAAILQMEREEKEIALEAAMERRRNSRT